MQSFPFIRVGGYVAAAMVLSGCAASMIVGGTLENTVEAKIDEASFTPNAKRMLTSAKSLGVVSTDRSAIKAADIFETRGGYVVRIDRQTAKQGEMTGSERREALANLCKERGVDVAMLGRVLKTETGNMIGTMFTGRMKTTLNWAMEMLSCGPRTSEAFGGTLLIDFGVYNANSSKLEEDIGTELGTKILAAIGGRQSVEVKAPPQPTPVSQVSAAPQALQAAQRAPAPVAEAVMSNGAPAVPSTRQIQLRLTELGYPNGSVDGVLGRRTIDALKKFQQDQGLPISGQATPETVERLMKSSR